MTSSSNINDSNDIENTDDQPQNNTVFDSFYHGITETAISDDGKTMNLFWIYNKIFLFLFSS
jgi:hypothetical protein